MERIAAGYGAVKPQRKETVRVKKVEVTPLPLLSPSPATPTTEECYTITVEVDKEFMELFEELKALTGLCTMRDLFKRTMKEYFRRHSPQERVTRRVEKGSKKTSRHIPAAIRDEVFLRDEGRCSYVSCEGKRCDSRHGLELDHIIPFARGGDNSAKNLRLLCPAHNLLMAERYFGRTFMDNRRHPAFAKATAGKRGGEF